MAATFAEATTILENALTGALLVQTVAADITDNVLALEDTAIQALEGPIDVVNDYTGALAAVRESISTAYEAHSDMAAAALENYRSLTTSSRTGDGYFEDLFQYWVDNSKTVNSRNFTRGSYSADGSNVGSGTFVRCTTDRWGYPIENTHADVITCTVVAAQGGSIDPRQPSATDRFQEIYRVEGRTQGDRLESFLSTAGSGLVEYLKNTTADDSLLNNPSFSNYTGAAAATPTDLTDWTVANDIANVEIDTTNYFREADIESGTPASVKLTATESLSQKLSVRGTKLGTRPHHLQVKYNRAIGSAGGTLLIRMGASNVQVAVSAQTGWNTLQISPGQGSWPDQFEEDELDISIEWTRTSGDILIDEVIFVPMKEFDNHWILPVGGATPEALTDFGTITDTEAGATTQEQLWRTSGIYLPSNNAGGESETDISVTTS